MVAGDHHLGREQHLGRAKAGWQPAECESPECESPECESPECESPECEPAECEPAECEATEVADLGSILPVLGVAYREEEEEEQALQ